MAMSGKGVQERRADADDKTPKTERGRRTRAALIEAARHVFEESGFLEARIADVADRAGMAHGSFYTYFATKEDVFREVTLSVQNDAIRDDLKDDPASSEDLTLGLVQRIERANRRYLESYVRNARIMAVIEQVATFNAELRDIRREVRDAYVERSTRAIARWQEHGLADPNLDPYYAANALGAMVDRFAYVWLVLGEDFELDKSVATLTRLWVQAIDLKVDPSDDRRRARGRNLTSTST